MEKDSPFNVFQRSSKKSGSSLQKTKLDKNESAPIQGAAPPPRDATTPSLEEIKEMIIKMKEFHENIYKKINETLNKTGFTFEEMRSYLENPANFSPSMWERVQSNKQALMDQIWSLLGSQAKSTTKRKEIQQKEKERKGKTIGARKQWLSMR